MIQLNMIFSTVAVYCECCKSGRKKKRGSGVGDNSKAKDPPHFLHLYCMPKTLIDKDQFPLKGQPLVSSCNFLLSNCQKPHKPDVRKPRDGPINYKKTQI